MHEISIFHALHGRFLLLHLPHSVHAGVWALHLGLTHRRATHLLLRKRQTAGKQRSRGDGGGLEKESVHFGGYSFTVDEDLVLPLCGAQGFCSALPEAGICDLQRISILGNQATFFHSLRLRYYIFSLRPARTNQPFKGDAVASMRNAVTTPHNATPYTL